MDLQQKEIELTPAWDYLPLVRALIRLSGAKEVSQAVDVAGFWRRIACSQLNRFVA